MMVLDWYALAGVGAIFLSFLAVRNIPRYALACGMVILAFIWTTRDFPSVSPGPWMVTLAGLCLAAFGLLIVRVMLIRSVSLQLLRHPGAALNDEFSRGIGSRLDDMKGFGLIRVGQGSEVRLSGFGQLVGSIVTGLYATFRIKV